MRNFNRSSRPDSRRDFGRRGFGGRGGDREMHQTICSSCGQKCEVPFKPTGSKPVFCSECFEEKGGGSDPKRFNKKYRSEQQPQSNAQLEAINTKLDKILAILKPASVKPAEEPTAKKS